MTCVYRISESCTLWPIHAMNEVKCNTTSATTSNANPACPTVHRSSFYVYVFKFVFSIFFFSSFFYFISSSFYMFNFANYGTEINDKVHLHFIHLVFLWFSKCERLSSAPNSYHCCCVWLLFIYSHWVHFRFSFAISINCDLPFITLFVQCILSFRCRFVVRWTLCWFVFRLFFLIWFFFFVGVSFYALYWVNNWRYS